MADEQEEVQISVEISADESIDQDRQDGNDSNLAVVNEEAENPEHLSENNIKENEPPGQEVPVFEISVDTASNENVTDSSPVNEEAAEKPDEESAEKPDEEPAEESAEVVNSEDTIKEIELGNEEVSIYIENNEEPEEEQGPLIETTLQPLSREGSPVLEEVPAIAEMPDASRTPPPLLLEGEEIDGNIQVINILSPFNENASIASSVEIPVYNRAELIEKYQQAVEERSGLQSLNSQLQHKLAEYFRKKKTDERQQEVEKNASDQEQRYIKYLANLDELQEEQTSEEESYKEQIEELKERCFEKQNRVTDAREEFTKHKYDIAKQALNSRSGRSIPVKDIDQYQLLEQKKDHEVMLVRLENIKLKNRLKKREMQLKAKEELAEGLHLIDFEQLKIENQTYNEKIEERNEELLKLRKKITTTVQVLTHLKEKLQFVQGENAEQRSNLKIVDARVAQKRDVLTRTKQARDALRIDNVKLRQRCGLLGNEPLLRDYEDRKDESFFWRRQKPEGAEYFKTI